MNKLFIYIVKFGKCLVDDKGKKKSTKKVKDPLSFEKWIFRNGQPDCDDRALTCNMENCICVVNLCFLNFVEFGSVILSNVTFGKF